MRLEPTFEQEWPGAEALATECGLNLGDLNSQLKSFGEALVRRFRIPSIAAFNLLTILHGAAEPLPPSVIAERMIVSRPTMTGIRRTPEQRGLVRRMPHPTDQRMVLIALLPPGREAVEALRAALHQAEKQLMSRLKAGEQRDLLGFLAWLQASAPRDTDWAAGAGLSPAPAWSNRTRVEER